MHIITYAPGDGSILFSNVDGQNHCHPVPDEDARNYFNTSEHTKHLRDKGWRLVTVNHTLMAVANVQRIDDTHVSLEGEPYRYTLDKIHEGRVHDSALILYFTYDHDLRVVVNNITAKPNGKEYEVKNWSIRASVRFFLENEEALKGQ